LSIRYAIAKRLAPSGRPTTASRKSNNNNNNDDDDDDDDDNRDGDNCDGDSRDGDNNKSNNKEVLRLPLPSLWDISGEDDALLSAHAKAAELVLAAAKAQVAAENALNSVEGAGYPKTLGLAAVRVHE
jgi:hypothetical protein